MKKCEKNEKKTFDAMTKLLIKCLKMMRKLEIIEKILHFFKYFVLSENEKNKKIVMK